MKLLCFGLLLIALIYCCLGTINLTEGLSNYTNQVGTQPHPGSDGADTGSLGPSGIQKDIHGRFDTTPATRKVDMTRVQDTNEKSNEYQNMIRKQCAPGMMDEHGYCHENNAKNKNSYPADYKHKKSCDDAGFIWNEALKKCQYNLGPGGLPPSKHHDHTPKNKHACEKEGFIWNSAQGVCEKNWPGKGGAGTRCGPDKQWDIHKKECVSLCPPGMHWNHKKKTCVHGDKDHCPKGKKWSDKKNKCIKKHKNDDDSSDSSSDDDWEDDASKDWKKFRSNINKFFNRERDSDDDNSEKHKKHHKHYHTDPATGKKTFAGSYPSTAVKHRHEILPGDENLYILKSQIVPPVCPACPPVIEGGGCPAACKAKCAPCPRPPPIQPCPPCERCPEPQFQCKKVPDYRNIIPGNLPRPLLNDFSQFT